MVQKKLTQIWEPLHERHSETAPRNPEIAPWHWHFSYSNFRVGLARLINNTVRSLYIYCRDLLCTKGHFPCSVHKFLAYISPDFVKIVLLLSLSFWEIICWDFSSYAKKIKHFNVRRTVFKSPYIWVIKDIQLSFPNVSVWFTYRNFSFFLQTFSDS